MDKRRFLKGMSLAAVAGFVPTLAASQQTKKAPNVLFITADDLDHSLIEFMGGPKGLMPNLEALAARSHRMTNARAVVPICQPSREALLSGKLPQHSGATGFNPMNEGTPTLVTMLQKHDYFAGAIRKVEHMLPQSSFPWDYAQGAPTYERASMNRNPQLFRQGMELAIAEAKSRDKPFFISCNISDPHRPFYGSPAGLKMDHGNQGPYRIANPLGPSDVVVPPFLDDLPAIREELAQYWNSAQRFDVALGKALQALQASGEADNTIVMFTSDHGMPMPFSKATVYDSGTRCPVLLSWPGMGAPRTFDNLMTLADVVPTVLDLLDLPIPGDLDGTSQAPLLTGKAMPEREFVVTYVNALAAGSNYPQRAIQTKRYAYIFSPWSDGELAFQSESMRGLTFDAMVEAAKGSAEVAARVKLYRYGQLEGFYDILADPGQRHNLIGSRKHASEIKRLKEQLFAYLRQTGDPQFDNFVRLREGQPMVVMQGPRSAGGE